MLDLKALNGALIALEEEKKIPRAKILEAIENALAAAYKKDYGKKGQIVRAKFDEETGTANFYQVKIVVDESTVRMPTEGDEEELEEETEDTEDLRGKYNSEHHILLDEAQLIKRDAKIEDEIVFPLETQEDFGRVAAQTAKQVIIQKIRDAEREAVLDEFGAREGEVIQGFVDKFERGTVFVSFGRAMGIIPPEEQIPGERYNRGERIKAYLYRVEDGPRGVSLRLSRTHPKLVEALFAVEAPEIESGVVEIKAIAREAGARTKIAVYSADPQIDPVGSCVGQRGIRVASVMSELGPEKIDIIPYSDDTAEFIARAIAPAKALSVLVSPDTHTALVEVADEQLSLAIGKGGQNVRLAAKLTGWRIDIKGVASDSVVSSEEAENTEEVANENEETV